MIHRTHFTSVLWAQALNNEPLNYPQPTEIQKAKLRVYDQFKENQRAAKGKGGYTVKWEDHQQPTPTARHRPNRNSKTCWTRVWRCCSRCALHVFLFNILPTTIAVSFAR
jgi:hypothetical protein